VLLIVANVQRLGVMKNSADAHVPLSMIAAENHGRDTVLTRCQQTLVER
jgi:hypothetical protein